jgi:phospholipid/cholesterol/gamma-HCH transport system substrate-binding protein
MVSGMIRGQLIAFVVVTALGVSYACLQYLGVPRMLGVGIYRVTLELPRASGLYESAIVTYRGIQVGKVEQLDLDRTGVAAVLGIDDDASIPVDSMVTVRSTSAIGEQYVNFEPVPDSSAPPLVDGQVIPGDRVGLPTPAGDLLASVNQLTATLPLDKLHDTVDELYDAFNGTGPELAGLLRAGSRLQRLATDDLDPTVRLIEDLVPVLATQQRISPAVRSLTGDLAAVTDTLRTVDPSIRGAIDKTGPMADEFDALLMDVRPTLPQLLTDLLSTSQVLRVYLPNLQHTIVVFPAAVAALTSTTAKGALESDGKFPPPFSALGFGLTLSPPPCTTGFEADKIPPSDLSNSHPPPTDAYCKEPKNSPIAVRGYRNAPCPPGSPAGPRSTGATAAACGWQFQTPDRAKAATDAAIKHMLDVAARNPKTRAENEAFIGDADFDGPKADPTPPAINSGSTTTENPNGTFGAGGQLLLNGGRVPLPQVGTAAGPVPGVTQFLLAPMLSQTGR